MRSAKVDVYRTEHEQCNYSRNMLVSLYTEETGPGETILLQGPCSLTI